MAEERVEKNKIVTFVYTITDEAGEVLEQSDIPNDYLHDQDERMFPRVMEALEGHQVGDTVTVTLTPEEGFGHYDPSLTFSDDLKNVPKEYQRIGAEAEFRDDTGQAVTMRVTSIENGRIELDGNPPFVDRTVVFIINILGIRDSSAQEVDSGQPVEPAQTSKPTLH
ncbi:FKBP-type peptidyl-prolyl cis-trans isomerase [Thiohalophilus sp.]|uniref:FKBP-type peptidyl-prolyl cis-trans isomerase n=1 Tax=Thiohalophilus sp. TaxID=3028392 RepID=UPI002ACE64EC|nr:FKBP-type peptidyl-prolyl cis-trans isomerase [Thiohalophilus sp.]MDZ7803302.1 FKBP-type peptidyl-prolyl cis-trans isomerase [Thiohalophilus sp.]